MPSAVGEVTDGARIHNDDLEASIGKSASDSALVAAGRLDDDALGQEVRERRDESGDAVGSVVDSAREVSSLAA